MVTVGLVPARVTLRSHVLWTGVWCRCGGVRGPTGTVESVMVHGRSGVVVHAGTDGSGGMGLHTVSSSLGSTVLATEPSDEFTRGNPAYLFHDIFSQYWLRPNGVTVMCFTNVPRESMN